MRSVHRLSRRLFLSELGRGTLAVTVLGAGAVACSSDNGSSDAASTSDDAATTTTTTGNDTTTATDADSATAGELQWERVDLGFVSAYVLARGREVAIVDTGTEGSGDQIESALSALSVGWGDVDHVIVTHAHGDHVGALDEVLTRAGSATGYAGVGDVEGLSAPRDLVAVSDGDEVFGLNVIGTPGHTPGHISVLDPATGLLVAGDAMITEDGRLAGPSAEFSDDVDLANQSVRDLAAGDPVTTIVVGHGDPVVDDAATQLTDLAASL